MKGIDLSNNNDYDFAANPLHAEFAIIKVSEGLDFVDGKAEGFIKSARAHGIIVGVYHFYRDGGTAEAQHFIKSCHVVGYEPTPGKDIVPMLDDEEGLGREVTITAFRNEVQRQWKVRTGFYSDVSFIREHGYSKAMRTMPLWLANPSGLPVPSPWQTAMIVQTNTGSGAAIDLNTSARLPIIPPDKVVRWHVHVDDKLLEDHPRHPYLWELRHPRRFRDHHQVGFRKFLANH